MIYAIIVIMTFFGFDAVIADNNFKHNPEFNSYMEDFEMTSMEYGPRIDTSKVKINYGNSFKKTEIATCIHNAHVHQIHVRRSYWVNARELDKEQTIFHELGHCAMGLSHDDTHLNIMNTYKISYDKYSINRDTLLYELFKRK